jgi:ribose transport system substrate-binding protein
MPQCGYRPLGRTNRGFAMRGIRSMSALALAGALVIASCGGDDDASSSEEVDTGDTSETVPAPTTEAVEEPSVDGAADTSTTTPATTDAGASTDESAGAEDAPTTTETADGTDDLSAYVETLYAGTYVDPPSDSPPAATDKSVWVISCGEAAVGCAELAGGAREGAEEMGWDVTLYDGRLGADGAYPAGVRQAVAAGADAILVGAVDCPLIAQPLAEARDAGIVVVGMLGYDCDDERFGGGESLFDGWTFSSEDRPSITDESLANGDAKAAWLMHHDGTDGLQVLVFHHVDSLLGSDYAAGFEARIEAECPTCEIVPIDFTFADLATGTIGSKASDALVKYPNADALFVPYDSLLLLGVAQAVAAQ